MLQKNRFKVGLIQCHVVGATGSEHIHVNVEIGFFS